MDRMLLEGESQPRWRDLPGPVCKAQEGETPMDARLMRLQVHLFGVTTLISPPEQNRINLEIQGGGRPCSGIRGVRDPHHGRRWAS